MMRSAIVASTLVGAGAEAAESGATHWAVLVAGSSGYSNYRHQADICHAYHVLLDNGYKASNIITMMYDDVAGSSSNPFKGQLYNHPGNSKDVYKGCKIDYRGSQVTPENFMKVLTGKGSGKVLKSTSNDHVFINFADHGAPGLIAFPRDVLHVSDLKTTLNTMHSQNMYKKLTFYLEACESGSMFEGYTVPGVYAISAANPTESSWAAYCGSEAVVKGKNIGSCLGDLFSVNWMEDSDANDITSETLQHQFKQVKKKTTKSHVMQWSDTSFTKYKVSAFQGETFKLTSKQQSDKDPSESAVSVRELELQQAKDNYLRATTSEERLAAGVELQAVLQDQLAVETAFEKFLDIVYPGDDAKKAAIREAEPVPDNRDCEVTTHQSFNKHGAFDAQSGFAMQFHKYVVNTCTDVAGSNVDLAEAAKQACIGSTVV